MEVERMAVTMAVVFGVMEVEAEMVLDMAVV